MRFSELKNSRVAILGVGREGLAVWRQLRRRYPDKPLSLFSESAISEELRQQFDPAVDELHIGPLDIEGLGKFDLLVRSAGISIYRDELVRLRSSGVRFTTASNLWFAENPTAKTICITGSLGKSTTAKLIAHLLGHAGVGVCLAGNIGRPMLDCQNEAAQWWVIELSSYQISDLEAKPDIAVLLNISEEHLDWHRGIERYKADKLRLAQLASDGRIIANYSDDVLRQSLKDTPDVTWFNKSGNWQAGVRGIINQPGKPGQSATERRQVVAPASLPGEHNAQNIAAALTVIDTMGLDIPRLDEALSSFRSLPHRLQLIGERAGVSYVNDSISTTPVSVAAALQTVGHQGVVLLLGGLDRGLDWKGFANSLLNCAPHAIIALPDNGPNILDCMKSTGVKLPGGLHSASGLKEAVLLAERLVPENGCVLLSPGAPSYPHFRDYEDRGQQFEIYSGFK